MNAFSNAFRLAATLLRLRPLPFRSRQTGRANASLNRRPKQSPGWSWTTKMARHSRNSELALSKRAVARILANAAIEVPPLRSEAVTAAAPGIVNRYLAGDSIPDLVASTGISHSTVRRVLLDARVQLRPRKGRAKHV